jgi:coproporphyrinogen III oxidase-like Fe-S oxidoreductase
MASPHPSMNTFRLKLARTALTQILHLNYTRFGSTGHHVDCLPPPDPGQSYLLYIHIPFCNHLCPYCFFTRVLFEEGLARAYFSRLREELTLMAERGYQVSSMYIGGGTPTVLIDELISTIEAAKELFDIQEVSVETNPNHLTPDIAGRLIGYVQRLSVGVQSFDDSILKHIMRYESYGSADQVFERLCWAASRFDTLNIDMIFNFPGQTLANLRHDVERVKSTGANQTTFHSLMVSPLTERELTQAVGWIDYDREIDHYNFIAGALADCFQPSSAWTYTRTDRGAIDEYIIEYPQYIGLGAGAFSYLNGNVYVNASSLKDYQHLLAGGHLSASMMYPLSRRDQMRYRFMTDLVGLKLDKQRFESEFGIPLSRGLWQEMAFMRAAGAFAKDDDQQLTLTESGRYLMMVMLREFFVCVNTIREQSRKHHPELPAG